MAPAMSRERGQSPTAPNAQESRPQPAVAGILGLSLLGTTALSALGVSAGAYGARLGLGFQALLIATAVAINAGVMIVAFRVATARNLTAREVAPGAVAAALAWQLLQSFGTLYVGHIVKSASAINGVFAFVLGLIGFIYLAAVATVLCVEINVVRYRRLYPRALLTPFSDNVELTAADRRAYTAQAQAQRAKGFEELTSASPRSDELVIESGASVVRGVAPRRWAHRGLAPRAD